MSQDNEVPTASPGRAFHHARGLQALERLLKLAAALFDCQSAVLLFNQAGVSRIVCGYGVRADFLSYRWTYAQAPYEPGDRFVVADAIAREDVQHASAFIGGRPVGFFLRLPVKLADGHTVTLIVLNTAARPEPSPTELQILDDIAGLVCEEFAEIEPLLADPSAHVSVATTLDALKAHVVAMPVAAALLDDRLSVVTVNGLLAAMLGSTPEQVTGRQPAEFYPRAAEMLSYFGAKAIADRVSSPAIEITAQAGGGGSTRSYSLVASPLSPIGTDDYFLLVTVRDITARVDREERVIAEVQEIAGAAKPAARRPEPSAEFLFETLVERRTIRNRNAISYLTVRSWRQPLRKFQIAALRALKQNVPHDFADGIAREIADGVGGLVGTAAFKTVVPIPCGHSHDDTCLSVAVARALAARLELPLVHALHCEKRPGTSHPRTNARRPPLVLAQAVEGPVLLIDDVATSGAHLQEGVELLKPHCHSVLPVAWIGGDATTP